MTTKPPAPVGMPPEPSGYEFMLTYSEGSDGRAVAEYAKALRTWATAEIARLEAEVTNERFHYEKVHEEYALCRKLLVERAAQKEAAERQNAELTAALKRIEKWFGEFPPAKLRDETPTTYGTAYGSNGERDYMRGIARKALAGDAP